MLMSLVVARHPLLQIKIDRSSFNPQKDVGLRLNRTFDCPSGLQTSGLGVGGALTGSGWYDRHIVKNATRTIAAMSCQFPAEAIRQPFISH